MAEGEDAMVRGLTGAVYTYDLPSKSNKNKVCGLSIKFQYISSAICTIPRQNSRGFR